MANEIKWITINGTHIPIMPGQNKKEAVSAFLDAIKNSDEANRTTTKRLKEKLTVRIDGKPKYIEKKVNLSDNSQKRVTISSDHYSRLRVMWSDYNRGACKPVEKDGVKYFNVDKSIYFTKGEYPDFYVYKERTFSSHALTIKFLKEIQNGK